MTRILADTYLHVGIHPDKIGQLEDILEIDGRTATLAEHLSPIGPYIDGDGWNAWGEKPGTDVNDPQTRHVIFHAFIGMEPLPLVEALFLRGLLTPLGPPFSTVIAVLSSRTDWSEGSIAIHRSPAGRLTLTVD